jgi:hypothetical protein
MNQNLFSFKNPLPDLPPKGKEIFSPLGDPDSYRERKGVRINITTCNNSQEKEILWPVN